MPILETFNLLLANSGKPGHLVYLFSQPTLHDFLFDRIQYEREDSETIEYYVQLLKTITLKLSSPEHRSMIKLFCNSRAPHFPLLTVSLILGAEQKLEELVRVTANQCVLLLIGAVNDTEIGLEYLSEIQFMVYFHSFVDSLFSGNEENCLEQLRFAVDLMLSLKRNTISLVIFMNLLTNHLLFRHGFLPPKIIRFLISLHESMNENHLFPKELAEEIMLVLCRVVTKYLSAETLNYTYFTAQKTLPIFHMLEKPNLIKFYQSRCKKIEQHLIKDTPLVEN